MTHKNTSRIGYKLGGMRKKVEELEMSDIRHKLTSSHFDIDGDNKRFYITRSKLTIMLGKFPWPEKAEADTGVTKLGGAWPKISMISKDTGKDATFRLAEATNTTLVFKPSAGTIGRKHPQLRGWEIWVSL